jgi:SAM-dependent methyltransferase
MTAARLDGDVINLLYRRPDLYEAVYPDSGSETAAMCGRMFERYMGRRPASILDVGCGTARCLSELARHSPDCWGIDRAAEMVAHGRRLRPDLRLSVADMREARLGRTFDAITCLGSVLMYALTNPDLDRALGTFAAHARTGTLLVLDLNNAFDFLHGGSFRLRSREVVEAPGFTATATVANAFDARHQVWIRRRTWTLPDGRRHEDYCEYRLLLPAELEDRLARAGWEVVGMFDNTALEPGALRGRRLYVAATYRGDAGGGRDA